MGYKITYNELNPDEFSDEDIPRDENQPFVEYKQGVDLALKHRKEYDMYFNNVSNRI